MLCRGILDQVRGKAIIQRKESNNNKIHRNGDSYTLALLMLVTVSLMSLWNIPILIWYKITSSLFPEPTDLANTFSKVSRVPVCKKGEMVKRVKGVNEGKEGYSNKHKLALSPILLRYSARAKSASRISVSPALTSASSN